MPNVAPVFCVWLIPSPFSPTDRSFLCVRQRLWHADESPLSVGVATVVLMTTEPLTESELRNQVAQVLRRYGMSVDDFVAADIDDLPSDELRDVWLMVKGALSAA